jgi:hypothetical protein
MCFCAGFDAVAPFHGADEAWAARFRHSVFQGLGGLRLVESFSP